MNELGIHLTILVATASICCRAGLNVIDRYYFSRHRGAVVAAGIINNALPVGILFVPFVVAVGVTRLVAQVASWRAIVLAIIVQAVAYVFSMAFREHSIPKVIVAAKLPDIFIPVGLFLLFGRWSTYDYLFSIGTVVACMPVWLKARQQGQRWPKILALMCVLLSLQGTVSPWLFVPNDTQIVDWILFTGAVIFWRLVWSCAVGLIAKAKHRETISLAAAWSPVLILRAFISIGTQLSFIVAGGAGTTAVAWPILNSAALVATFMSSVVLLEHPKREELIAIGAIAFLAILRCVL